MAGEESQPKSKAPAKFPAASNLNRNPRWALYSAQVPYRTPPSGRAVGDDDDRSTTCPEPRSLVVGSTPWVVPGRQQFGVTKSVAIGTRTPQPLFRRRCKLACHLGVRSGLTAT